MNKKKILAISIIVLIFVTMGIILFKNNNKDKSNIIAITVDGSTSDTMPTDKNYQVTPTCSNANGSWNYSTWELNLSNVTGSVVCTLAFDTISTDNKIYNYITTHDTSVGSDGYSSLTIDNNTSTYRYIGASPNNYVMFNNERWRIIGFFDEHFHGQSGKVLAKIIRDESIGGYSYDTNLSDQDENFYANSSIYYLLNNAYLNAQSVSGSTNGCSNGYYSSAPMDATCDFTQIGLNSVSRNMIVNANWYVLDYDYSDFRYDYSYGNIAKVSDWCDNPDTGECTTNSGSAPSITTGYVGLPSLSDYFNTLGDNPLTTSYYYENTYPSDMTDMAYSNASWLMSSTAMWLIDFTFYSDIQAYATYDDGLYSSVISLQKVTASNAVKPTVYLDENVLIVSGTGTYDDPYIITK